MQIMAQERKRVKPKLIIKAEPKRRPPKVDSAPQVKPAPRAKVEPKLETKKGVVEKYLKVCLGESDERFKEVGEMVFKKELKWAYFATDNNQSCHFYRILKKQ